MNELNIRVDDPTALIGYGNDMIGYASEYTSQITNIYNELDTLAESWTGSKSENFMSVLKGYQKSFTEFGENLTNFGDLIKKTGEAYSNWDK